MLRATQIILTAALRVFVIAASQNLCCLSLTAMPRRMHRISSDLRSYAAQDWGTAWDHHLSVLSDVRQPLLLPLVFTASFGPVDVGARELLSLRL